MRRTEERNPRSVGMDEKTPEEILKIINAEDRTIPEAIAEAIPEIAEGVEAIAETVRAGGRVFFLGAGTSGRLGVLEAAEIPPTFGVSPDLFRAFVSGGPGGVFNSVEASEDDEASGGSVLVDHDFGGKDLLVAISASGGTPFALGAMRKARSLGARIVAITNNRGSAMGGLADFSIVVDTGPEVVSGSTRMKAGTAQKMVLNMLTTAAMTRLGKVHDGYMIGVQASNVKLRGRAARIVGEIAGVGPEEAMDVLEEAKWDLKVAVVMIRLGIERKEAEKALADAGGVLRRALERAP
ncbi:MAG: N-acetylmuramic acid 6-phosphate etherase [Candidatus Bathyarchaeota archaeon]|nr:N-acetylmuramic acid 6-phosphate etherase [Candidatus Bathyarchaeota archaeon]